MAPLAHDLRLVVAEGFSELQITRLTEAFQQTSSYLGHRSGGTDRWIFEFSAQEPADRLVLTTLALGRQLKADVRFFGYPGRDRRGA